MPAEGPDGAPAARRHGSPGNAGGGLGDVLGGLSAGSRRATAGATSGGNLGDLLSGGLGGLLGGAAAGSVLSGGLGNLIKGFQESGHGHAAESWVGTGPNKEIAPATWPTRSAAIRSTR